MFPQIEKRQGIVEISLDDEEIYSLLEVSVVAVAAAVVVVVIFPEACCLGILRHFALLREDKNPPRFLLNRVPEQITESNV